MTSSWYGQVQNKKNPSIKFEFKYSKTKIDFYKLHKFYKDQNNMLQTAMYRQKTDQQDYLDARLEHPKLLSDSIPWGQAL